ncbi:MAG: TIGR03435 family protein [Terracidiphilus sp.]
MTARPVHRLCRWMILFALSAVVIGFTRYSMLAQGPVPVGSSDPRSKTERPPIVKSTGLSADPVFDVVSIHPNNSDHTARTHIYSYADRGHFIAINATLMQLLEYAYAIPDSRIIGAPAWTKSAKYDIEGKSDPEFAEKQAGLPYSKAKPQLLKMVQTLLADRFHLAAHLESRELPVYDLVVSKEGAKLANVKEEGTTIDSGTHFGSSTITIKSSPHATADLAEMLARFTGRVVLDKTGLQGNYTINLKFASDDARSGVPNTETVSVPDAGPSVFTALKEQLGLELKSSKAPVDVLVIDHIDPPSEN